MNQWNSNEAPPPYDWTNNRDHEHVSAQNHPQGSKKNWPEDKLAVPARQPVSSWIIYVRWQLVALLIGFLGPDTFGRKYLSDPWFQGSVNYLMSALIAAAFAFIGYVFFTRLASGRVLLIFHIITIFMTSLIVAGGWISCNRVGYC